MKTRKNYKLELYHDTLARRIFDRASQEDKIRLQIERLVRDKYNFFQSGKGGLLSKDELSLINSHRSNLHLQEAYLPYIKQSQQAVDREEKKEVRRLRNLLFAAVGVLLLVGLLGLWALRERAKAKKSAVEAQENAENERLARERADSLLKEINSTNDQLIETGNAYYRAKVDAEVNAIEAEKNAANARQAERVAQNQKEQAIKKSIAYRLLVVAVDQKNKGELQKAFRIAERANAIAGDSAILDFMRQTYNDLPEQDKLITSFELGSRIEEAEVSPNGTAVLLKHRRGLAIWHPQTNDTIDMQARGIKHATFSPDGAQFITAVGKTATVWNTNDGTSSQTYTDTVELKRAFLLPGNRAVTVGNDHIARLWLPGKEQPVAAFSHDKEIRWVTTNKDGDKIATASSDKIVKLWDVAGTLLDSFEHPFDLEKALFSPDSHQLLAQDFKGTLWLWNLKKKQDPKRFVHKLQINNYTFTNKGNYILSASNDETARLWNVAGQLEKTYSHTTNEPGVSSFINDAIFSPDEAFILTGTELNQVHFWDRDGYILADYTVSDKVKTVRFIDQDKIIAASGDGKVYVWKAYPAHVAAFDEVGLPEIGQMGYEMPIAYWMASNDPVHLKSNLDYFLVQVDNFKQAKEQLKVLAKAVGIAEKWMRVQDLVTFSDEDREKISNRLYGNLSWNNLLDRKYLEAEKAALRSLEIYPEKEWVKTNLALAYVLTGRYNKARPIYLALAAKPFDRDEGEEKLFKYFFLDDLKKLNNAGVDHPDFKRVKQLLEGI